jgi:hypothetical protein
MTLQGVKGGIEISNLPSGAGLMHFQYRTNIEILSKKL